MTAVEVACTCPERDGERPHDHDTITLRETLDFRAAVAIRNEALMLRANDPGASVSEIMAVLSESYILHGIVDWTLTNGHEKKLPVSRESITERILAYPEVAIGIADIVDSLYGEKVVLPLLARASTSSPTTPTPSPTSATNGGPSMPRKRRSRSSTSTTPTDDTGTTSPPLDGDSSSSPS